MTSLFLYLLTMGAVCAWVAWDARQRHLPSPGLWAAGVFIFNWLGLAAYLAYSRATHLFPVHRHDPPHAPLPPAPGVRPAGGPVGRVGGPRPQQAKRRPAAPPREPEAIGSFADLEALIALAADAAAAQDRDEVVRLMRRIFEEAAISDLGMVVTDLGQRWFLAIQARVEPALQPVVQGLLAEAVEAVRQEDFARAHGLMVKATGAVPGLGSVHPGGALILAGLAGYLGARAGAPPEEADASPEVAVQQWAARAGALRAAGAHEEAVAWFDRALAESPDVAGWWFHRADSLEVLGRLPEALASYDRALACDDTLVDAWVDRGHVLHQLQRPEEAHASHVRACELAPTKFEAWINRAEQARVLGLREDALGSYRRFLEVAPATGQERFVAHAQAQLAALQAAPAEPAWRRAMREAITAEQAGDLASAERGYQEALAADPALLPAWQQLAKLHRKTRRIPEALAAFERVVALNPADDQARGMLADLQQRLGQYEAALATIATLPAPHPYFLRQRGRCLFALGRAEEALAALAEVPDDDLAVHVDRGLVLERLGRKDEAIASYERGHVMSGRKWFHLARHQPAQATDYFGRAIEALLAEDRVDGLDKMGATELAFARKKLAELDPERLAALEAFDQERRGALPL